MSETIYMFLNPKLSIHFPSYLMMLKGHLKEVKVKPGTSKCKIKK